jgi:hypothetical protein
MLFSIVLYFAVLCCTVLYRVVLCCVVLFWEEIELEINLKLTVVIYLL